MPRVWCWRGPEAAGGLGGKDTVVRDDTLLRTPLGVDEVALERSRRSPPGSQQEFLLGKG